MMASRPASVRRLFAALAALALAGAAAAARAGEPPVAPQLRVETGAHTTLIRRLVVDAPRNRLITCSDDKTVRVWQMPETRLVSTLRVPIDAGHEGQLFAIDVSPDGRTVVAGGWTGWDWDGESAIYFFDTATGILVGRHSGFKDAISTLNWTRDGKHLIVGLQARGGLHLLRMADMAVVASDLAYADKIMEVDVRADGLIAAASLDGRVRLYDRTLKILGRRAIPGGAKISTLRFAPDGNQLAVGFIDAAAVAVVNTRDLSVAFTPDMANVKDQANVTSVAWSADGRQLYAGGDYRGRGTNPIYRWGEGGRAAAERIPVADNRITELQQMKDGAIAFVTEDPSFGVIGPNGKRLAYRGPDIIDFADAQEHLAVSSDGTVIRYPLKRGGLAPQTFSPGAGGDQVLAATPAQPVAPPLRQAAEIRVENWQNSFAPTINGKRPQLDEYEQSRSYAIAPDRKAVLLGTEWALRLFDREAKELWSVKLPSVAWAVNIAGNGKLAVAALSDGTLRWYRMTDGREMLAYFPHNNGTDWIAWVPEGYYMSSVYGDNFVGWHVNRGRDLTPDFYRAVQFDRILYRPDVVASRFRAGAGVPAAGAPAPANADFRIDRLPEIAPPRIVLRSLSVDGAETGRPRLKMQVEGERLALPIKDYTVFVNNIPVTPRQERGLAGAEAGRFTRSLELNLPRRANDIRVEAFNGVSMGVAETFVSVAGDVAPSQAKGNLYLLAVGVNNFPYLAENAQLAFAAQDAGEVVNTIRQRAGGRFQEVFVRTLADGQPVLPTRLLILAAFDFIQQARPEDTVIIFLASHGVADAAGNYYFVPRDVRPEDVAAAARGKAATGALIHWSEFFEALRGTPGQRILIVDTCHARGIEGSVETHSLLKRSAASLFPILVASKGEEKSQEYEPGEHGLFTYALLSALTPAADKNRDRRVTLRELFETSALIVERLRDKTIGPQTPQLVAPGDLGDATVMGAD